MNGILYIHLHLNISVLKIAIIIQILISKHGNHENNIIRIYFYIFLQY